MRDYSTGQISAGQGIFYIVSGLWPVFHRKSFEAVTGPKVDFWLVKTVGLLIACTGTTLTLASAKRRITPEVAVLGASTAASLAAIDIVYGGTRRISRVYLLDAVIQAGIAGLWMGMRSRQSARPEKPANRQYSGTFKPGGQVAG